MNDPIQNAIEAIEAARDAFVDLFPDRAICLGLDALYNSYVDGSVGRRVVSKVWVDVNDGLTPDGQHIRDLKNVEDVTCRLNRIAYGVDTHHGGGI